MKRKIRQSDIVVVPIKRVLGRGKVEIPAYQTEDSAGMDVSAAIAKPMKIEAGKTKLVPTGFALAVPKGFEAQIRPRSGLAANQRISIPNSPATIDADYRGEILILLTNFGSTPFVVRPGMRIAQMIIVPVPRVTFKLVTRLPITNRGNKGFGHTGK